MLSLNPIPSLRRKRSFSAGDIAAIKLNNSMNVKGYERFTSTEDPLMDREMQLLVTLPNSVATSLSDTICEEVDEVEEYIFDDCNFPFTNLIFEGGGNKGMAYVGSLEV